AANEQLKALHDRMPVVVDEEDRDAWLDPARDVIDLARLSAQRELPGLRFRPVSSRLGNVRNDDESLLIADVDDAIETSTPTTPATGPKKKATTKKKTAQGDLF
ncbi:MAG TPA: SOS response-associated peptidase family protein, partial [Myxococcota bacterium]